MNFKQAFKIAAKSIAAKKGRSALTMLGIIIGLAAVIALVSFAQGQNKWINDLLSEDGRVHSGRYPQLSMLGGHQREIRRQNPEHL